MKIATFVALLLVFIPMQASALQTDELLGIVALPLAVAAASEVTGVPAGELSQLVATLNRAQVPPTQVVQVIRYAPAALVVEHEQPTFVQFVDQQVDSGIVGPRLVTVIEERYRTYDLEPQFVALAEPATTYVVREEYIPPVVVTRVAETRPAYLAADSDDLLSLIAMPLAVAAAAELTGVPMNDLSMLVASLNQAAMPPAQIVKVLRYAPVAFVVQEPSEPRFVQYVQTHVVRGVRGPALVDVIEQRLRTYDVDPRLTVVERPRVTIVEEGDFFPPVVRTRVATARTHPHGGPPGQLKKERGLQTGAEVVHGTTSGRRRAAMRVDDDDDDGRRRAVRPARAETRREVNRDRPPAERTRVEQPRAKRRGNAERIVERQNAKPERIEKKRGNDSRGRGAARSGKGKGQGRENGKGKGKG